MTIADLTTEPATYDVALLARSRKLRESVLAESKAPTGLDYGVLREHVNATVLGHLVGAISSMVAPGGPELTKEYLMAVAMGALDDGEQALQALCTPSADTLPAALLLESAGSGPDAPCAADCTYHARGGAA